MSAQYHNGHWYGGGQDIDIQSDPTATSFESGKVPTGDTVQSVLNSKIGYIEMNVGGTAVTSHEDGWYIAELSLTNVIPSSAIAISAGFGQGTADAGLFFDVRRTGTGVNRLYIRSLTSRTIATGRTVNVFYVIKP